MLRVKAWKETISLVQTICSKPLQDATVLNNEKHWRWLIIGHVSWAYRGCAGLD